MSYGDRLASGSRSATFVPARISDEKWNSIWQDIADVDKKAQDYSGKNDKFVAKKKKEKQRGE